MPVLDDLQKMRKIEDFSNWLTDMDWGWWPLLNLRPEKNEDIDSRVVLKITPFYGTIVGLCFFAPSATIGGTLARFLLCIALGWAVFYFGYRRTCAVAWNRRAARLRKTEN